MTVFGATEEEVASELVRASVERAAGQLAREATGQSVAGGRPASGRAKARDDESGHSHPDAINLLESPIEPEWDATEATRFAITTVNVPDRLDLQEERDRADMEEYAEERRRVNLRAWMKRVLVVAVFGVFGAVLYGLLKLLHDDTSAARVGERLSAAFKRPVAVAETAFQVTPTPRLVMRGVDVGGQFKADEVSLLINWKDLWSALRGGQWVWSTILSFHLSLLHHGMVIVGLPYSFQGQMRMDEITGGSPYGASTKAGPKGQRMPSENELVCSAVSGETCGVNSFQACEIGTLE